MASNTSSAQLSPLAEAAQPEAPLIGIGPTFTQVFGGGGHNGTGSNNPNTASYTSHLNQYSNGTQLPGHYPMSASMITSGTATTTSTYTPTRRGGAGGEQPVVPPPATQMMQQQMAMDESQLLAISEDETAMLPARAYTYTQPTTSALNGKHLQQQGGQNVPGARTRTWTTPHAQPSHRPRGSAVALHSYVASNNRCATLS